MEGQSLNICTSIYQGKLFKEKFIEFIDVSIKTRETYLNGLKSFSDFIGEKNNVQRQDIIDWRNSIKKSNSSNTVNTYLVAVKSFFKFLEEYRIYPDISKNIKGLNTSTTPRKQVLSLEQTREIYKSLTTPRDKCLFLLCITTGIRLHEAVNINLEDIKEHNGEIVIWVLRKRHTEKDSYVKISEPILECIKEYVEDRKAGPLFISTSNNNKNGAVTEKTLRAEIKNILKGFGIDENTVSAHSLRRSCATILYQDGTDIYSIQQVLGHVSIGTTQRYINQCTRDTNKSEQRMTELVLEGVN